MTSEGLMAFIAWCRDNSPAIVFDQEIARRVFNAYEQIGSGGPPRVPTPGEESGRYAGSSPAPPSAPSPGMWSGYPSVTDEP